MSPLPSPGNQVYNAAVGDRTTLNELFAQIKTNLLPRYPPTQRVGEGLELAMPWYIEKQS